MSDFKDDVYLKDVMRIKERKQQILQLADGLMSRLYIPMHRGFLVPYIGKPGDRVNADAIATWVDKRFDALSGYQAKKRIMVLEAELQEQLSDLFDPQQ